MLETSRKEEHCLAPGREGGCDKQPAGTLGRGEWTGWVLLMVQLPLGALVESCLRKAWGQTQAHCLQPLPATSPAMLRLIVSPGTWNVQPRVQGAGLELQLVLRLCCGRAGLWVL